MQELNPFKTKNFLPRSQKAFTKQLKIICNPICIGDSVSVEIEGLTNSSLKSLLSKSFRGQFITVQSDGITWIKRISF
tara:strand:+ start:7977 stop:8210 length:234 start_codon:yes stop_codon:yes gene_type:complete